MKTSQAVRSKEAEVFMLNRFCIFILLAGFLTPLSLAHSEIKLPIPDESAFEENGNLFLKSGGEMIQLTQTGGDREPVLSPNGKWLAFSREIEGKIKECENDESIQHCPSDELWIMDLETKSTRKLLEPREASPMMMEKVIYQFNGVKFSPDSKTIYFITPARQISDAIHSVNIDGSNERYIAHGFSFEVVREPLLPKYKKFIVDELKEDDWRIRPKNEGADLVWKTLKDDVIGYLTVETSGIHTISSSTPIKGGWKSKDGEYYKSDEGKYYKSFGRTYWTDLVSPDGTRKIPIDEGYR